MFSKISLSVIALLFSFTGFSQEGNIQRQKPDLKKIEKDIKDNNSPFLYTTLMKRYTDNDTTLNTEDYRHLYYGYSFQKSYSPYGRPGAEEKLDKAMKAGDLEEVIDLQKKILKEFPFNLRNIFDLSVSMVQKGDTLMSDKYRKKLTGIADAIFSTGDGLTDTTAMYVISVDHEYDLISLLGFKAGGQQSLIQGKDGPMDRLALKKNDDKIDYFYFNVSRLFASMENMFKKN